MILKESTMTRGIQNASEQSNETLGICKQGFVPLPICGKIDIPIAKELQWAMDHTQVHEPSKRWVLSFSVPKYFTRFEVTQESIVEAGHRLWQHPYLDIAVLHLTQGGSRSDANIDGTCASALYPCISQEKCSKMHTYNQKNTNNGLYSDYMIYSPSVPVFRDKSGKLVIPYYLSFITTSNVDLQPQNKDVDTKKIERTMVRRICKILRVALHKGHQILVLDAFGCGVLPKDMARFFHMALNKLEYKHSFELVVFALKESMQGDPNTLKYFKRQFLYSQ